MQLLGPTSVAYIQPPSIRFSPATYALLDIGFTSAAYTTLTILNISMGHNRKLLNLAKIYTNDAKYSGCNDSFIFKLVIFHNIYSKFDVLPQVKLKTFLIMLKNLALNYYYSNISINRVVINFNQVCYSIKIRLSMNWMKQDTQDKMKDKRINIK